MTIRADAFKWSATEAKISDEERLGLYLDLLNKAINDPSPFYIYNILKCTESLKEHEITTDLGYFANSLAEYEEKCGFDIFQEILIVAKNIDNTSAGLISHSVVTFETNGVFVVDSIDIIFENMNGDIKFANLDEVLQTINDFILSSRNDIIDYVPESSIRFQEKNDKSSFFGPNMWAPSPISYSDKGSTSRFTFVHSSMLFDGYPILSIPCDILPLILDDPVPEFDHDILMVSDIGQHWLVIEDNAIKWLANIGGYGTGTHNFNQPKSITYLLGGNSIIVGDAFNRRAVVYSLEHKHLAFKDYLTNNYNFVIDVAGCTGCTGEGFGEIAVLDYGKSIVDIYDAYQGYDFDLRETLFGPGSGKMQLMNPTSICYEKSLGNGYHFPYLYVADNGNKRIVCTRTCPPYDYFETDYIFPENANLSSIDTDKWGAVYVLDKNNAVIYQFSANLQTMICQFGSKGTGDGQLYFPQNFKLLEGWRWPDLQSPYESIDCGNAYVTEAFTDLTGVRRYVHGIDILSHKMSFSARPVPMGVDVFSMDWLQNGPSTSIRRLFYQNNLLYEESSGINPVGEKYQLFTISDPLNEGYYTIEIYVSSIFGTRDTTFRDSIYIEADDCGFTSYWTRNYNEYEKEKALDIDTTIYGDYIMLACGGGKYDFYSDPNIYIKRLNTCGYPMWTHYRGGNGYHYSNSMTPTYDGGLVYVGDSATNYYAPSDIFATKLNSEGTILWNKYMGGSQDQNSWCIEQTTDSGFIMTGEIDENMLIIKLNKFGDSLWSRVYGDSLGVGKKVIQTNDGGYAIYSETYPGRVFKTDSQGDSIWSTVVIGDYGTLTNTCDGGYLMAKHSGGETIICTKLTANGAIAWRDTVFIDQTGYAGLSAGLETADENHGLAVAGFKLWPPGVFSEKVPYLVRTNKCADSLWTMIFDDFSGDSYLYDVIQTSDGSFILAGETECALSSLKSIESLADTNVPPIGTHDAFVIKIGPQPDQIEFLCGDVYVDGTLNLSDLLQLIEIVYNGAPKPDPRQRCDVNTDCSVNLLDVLLLLSFLYDTPPGTAPQCP